MVIRGKRRSIFYASLLICSAALAMLLFWALSRSHRPIEYMIAGTLITAVLLAAVFLVIVRRRLI